MIEESKTQNGLPQVSRPAANSPETPSARHRRGEIARLPKETRDRINEMLDDGLPYASIAEELGKQGIKITVRSVQSWKLGGYQDYLRQQQILAQCRARQFRVAPLLNHRDHVNTFQATQQVASAQICETVVEMGTEILRQALAANPLNYFRMLNSFARLTNGGLKCERYVVEELERKASGHNAKRPGRKAFTAKAMKELEEKLQLM